MCTSCALLDFWTAEKTIQLDTQVAFSQCLKKCYDNDTKIRNSYSSCLDGCGRAASTYSPAEHLFSSFELCENEINDIRTSDIPSESQGLCSDLSSDYKSLKGCEEGVATFYEVIYPYNVCVPIHDSGTNVLAFPDAGHNNNNVLQTHDLSE